MQTEAKRRITGGEQLIASVVKLGLAGFLTASLVAEAGLIRGGGRGSRTVIESSMLAGTVPFLIEDPKAIQPAPPPLETVDAGGGKGSESGGSTLPDTVESAPIVVITDPPAPPPGLPTTLKGSDLANAAAYGYGPSGFPVSASHNWGRDCALTITCVFELGAGETLDWMGHIVGLPPVLPDGESYRAVADLVVTWSLSGLIAPPPGFTIAGQDGSSSEPLTSWTTRFAADPTKNGNYLAGDGSNAITLGESIAYADAVATSESAPSCFTTIPGRPISSQPPTLDINQAYSFGSCREVRLDLSQALLPSSGVTGVTGEDLDQLLTREREFLYLTMSVELLAPDGFQFASLIEEGAPFGGDDAYSPTATRLSTPSVIRGLNEGSIRCVGCESGLSPRVTAVGSSFGLRINVVPIPSTFCLLIAGFGLGYVRRRKIARR
ncbi:MAG: hypothetical protein Cons2KO_18570 [Congregibacter sp.]